jgi:hypothetical protein
MMSASIFFDTWSITFSFSISSFFSLSISYSAASRASHVAANASLLSSSPSGCIAVGTAS